MPTVHPVPMGARYYSLGKGTSNGEAGKKIVVDKRWSFPDTLHVEKAGGLLHRGAKNIAGN
jgi:hypothetical protein